MEKPKVLYVDDEEINLELLKLTFLNEFNIITADSGEEGLSLLKKHPDIHVIVSDLKMPGMNGLDFLKEIKRESPQKVCILLTAYIDSRVMLEGINKELIFRYIVKPFDRDELKETILDAIRR